MRQRDRYLAGKALIRRTGIANCRDLGGYETKDGKYIRKGILYRSAGLVNLNNKQRAAVDNLGLYAIFDFRSKGEVYSAVDYIPDGCKYINVSGLESLDTYAAGAPGAESGQGNSLDMISLIKNAAKDAASMEKLEGYLFESYGEMVRKPRAYAIFFKTLLESQGRPVLFHCTAGKDRTGVASALFLRMMGIPKKSICADYLLTQKYRASENRMTALKLKIAVRNKRVERAVMGMLGVKPELLQNAFDTIIKEYTSFTEFVHQGLGLSNEDVLTLRNLYLQMKNDEK